MGGDDEVNNPLDKSKGVSAMIESMVRLYKEDLSNCNAGSNKFVSSPVGPHSGSKKARSSAPASTSLMTSKTTSLPIRLPTIVTSGV